MRHFVVLFTLLLHTFFCSAQASQENYLDSLQQALTQNPQKDTIRLSLLMELAELYKNTEPEKTFEYIQEGLDISQSDELIYQRAMLFRKSIQYYALKGNSEDAIKNGMKAILIFDSLEMKKEAMVTQSKLIPIFQAAGFDEKALEMGLKNLESVKRDPETAGKARYYFDVANSYRHMDLYEEAIAYYQEALRISESVNYKPGIAIISLNLGQSKIKLNEYTEAKELIESQLSYFEETKNISLLSTAVDYLGDIAKEQGDHEMAIAQFEKTLQYLEVLGFRARIQEVSMKLYIEYSLNGQEGKAILANSRYKYLRDSLENEKIAQIVGDLQTKYETEKKEAEIESLTQKTAIQELQIQQRNQASIIGIAILLLIAVVVYFIYAQRSAAKQRKQLELEQRFLLSQLNPHFISNALVAVQSSLMEKDTESASSYLHTFSRLMREIMENSREEFIPVEDEVSMLEDYLKINQRRLDHAFEYNINVDDSIDDSFEQMPPMFVQPFVENAIEHGLKPNHPNKIEVNFTKEGDYIRVSVLDNGEGLGSLEGNKAQRSLSTTIIQERIDVFNKSLKKKINLSIKNRLDHSGSIIGTQVDLQVPLG